MGPGEQSQVGIYESLPGTMQPHHHNASADGDFLWYDVRAFGALIDGITDNSAVIQAAINSMTSGGILFFPVGTCLGHFTLKNNVRILGEGFGSIIKLPNGAECDMIYALNKTGVAVENIFLDGNKAAQVGQTFYPLRYEGCSDSYFDTLFIQNGAYANLSLKNCARIFGGNIFSLNPYKVGIYLVGTTDSIIRGIHHQALDSGGASGHHGVLLYNGAINNQLSDIYIKTTVRIDGVTLNVNCHGNKISHVRALGCGNGLEINQSNYWEILDFFADNSGVAIGAEAGIEIIASTKGKILGAILKNNKGAGLYVYGGSNDNLFENILAEANDLSGFLINASLRNKFSNCKALSNLGRGFFLQAGSTYNEFVGCDADTNGVVGTYLGVEINASNYNKFLGGYFRGNGDWGIGEAGGANWSQVRCVFTSGNVSGGINLTGVNSVQTDNMSL